MASLESSVPAIDSGAPPLSDTFRNASPQFARNKESDVTAVGRPEWIGGVLASSHGLRVCCIDTAQPELGVSVTHCNNGKESSVWRNRCWLRDVGPESIPRRRKNCSLHCKPWSFRSVACKEQAHSNAQQCYFCRKAQPSPPRLACGNCYA